MPMKKVILFLMISTSVFIYSCKCDRAPESKSLTELIEYDAMINNNGLMDPIMGHLNEDMRLNFIHFLFEELKTTMPLMTMVIILTQNKLFPSLMN